VYRLSDFDMKRGTFYCEVICMLDWVDPSLSCCGATADYPVEKIDFFLHFWPQPELLNQTLDGGETPNWEDDCLPKYKRGDDGDPYQHHATMTVKFRANLFARLDYHQFPFDHQSLELSMKVLSVRSPGSASGTRPKACHPTRWRKEHELIPEW